MAYTPSEHEQRLIDIIKPLRTAKWQADFPWDRLESSVNGIGKDYGGLELCPDFQRGHVWTREQQAFYIENCLRGVVASNGFLLQFNCPEWNYDTTETDLPAGLQCIDGLQRFTAVTQFIRGEVKPFGLTVDELDKTQFSIRRIHMKLAIHDFTRRADLLDHYLALNAGGTPHSPEEIARVRALRAEL